MIRTVLFYSLTLSLFTFSKIHPIHSPRTTEKIIVIKTLTPQEEDERDWQLFCGLVDLTVYGILLPCKIMFAAVTLTGTIASIFSESIIRNSTHEITLHHLLAGTFMAALLTYLTHKWGNSLFQKGRKNFAKSLQPTEHLVQQD